ncbi:MAG: B12-binding domain-containing radical SAM protein [bacterium]
MKVLLVNPPLAGLYDSAGIVLPPLGLLYVAAVLREGGHHVRVLDLSANHRPLDFDGVDVVGITCTTSQYSRAIKYARAAKEAGKIVVMGGAHATFTAEEIFQTGSVDYVVRGEGEYTALELMNGLQRGGGAFDPGPIMGLSWFDRKEGRVVNNPDRPFVRDLDTIPYPARNLLAFESYQPQKLRVHTPSLTVLTSRGCPFHCTYCVVHRMNGRQWRSRHPVAVVDEIEEACQRYDFKEVVFLDDNLTFNVGRVLRLCHEMMRRNLNLTWWCMSRTDTIAKNEEMVAKMAQAGCTSVFLGLETANETVLQAYHKRATADVGAKAVALLKKYGISTLGAFMIGEVTESRQDIEKTIGYAVDLDPEVAQFSILTPYPGTTIFERLKDRLITRDWSKFDGAHGVFDSDHLTARQMEKLLRRAYQKFYLRPRRLFSRVRNGPTWRTVWSLLRAVR